MKLRDNRRICRLALVGVAVVAGLTSCGSGSQGAFPARDLIDGIQARPDHAVALGQVYDKKPTFDRAVVVCPFTPPEDVKRAVGANWSGASELRPEDESVNVLVFVDGDEVVGVTEFKRVEINFCQAATAGASTLEAGTPVQFQLEDNTDGSKGWTAVL